MNATIREHIEKHLSENTEKLLLQILRDLYVDDTATSFNDLAKAVEFYHITKSTLASRGLNWALEFSSYEIELRNRVTLNDVTFQVTELKIFIDIFLLSY